MAELADDNGLKICFVKSVASADSAIAPCFYFTFEMLSKCETIVAVHKMYLLGLLIVM